MNGAFITATDTGVGKTFVACALLRAAVRRGLRVAAMKPCETGEGDDGERLIAATGRALDPNLARPYRFAIPASPEAAAAAEHATVDVDRITSAFHALAADADLTIVEGAGGLLVPLAPGVLMVDLAARLGLPLLIVARASLGTVNHTLLTIEAARRRDLRVAGVIFTRASDSHGADEATNPLAIATHGKTHILGALPHVTDAAQLDELAERFLLVDDILKLCQIQPRAR
ncbi:MAG: dethiobiotin synthase [Myxococcales bacterium]|nr:dethiobiotin synthase [Myxococcales bacterium]